jgi:hypothetical protein
VVGLRYIKLELVPYIYVYMKHMKDRIVATIGGPQSPAGPECCGSSFGQSVTSALDCLGENRRPSMRYQHSLHILYL